jgi:uncharacterized protein YpmS
MLKKVGIIIGIIVVVIVIIVAIGYVLLTRPSNIEKQATSLNVSPEVAQIAEDKIQKFTTQLDEAKTGEVLSLTLTDDEVSSVFVNKLNSGGKSLPSEIENPRIMFEEDKIIVSGDVNISGVKTNIAIEAEAITENNQLKLTIGDVSAGKLPVPEAVINKLKESFTTDDEIIIDMDKLDIPIDLKNITIENGQIVIAGTAR